MPNQVSEKQPEWEHWGSCAAAQALDMAGRDPALAETQHSYKLGNRQRPSPTRLYKHTKNTSCFSLSTDAQKQDNMTKAIGTATKHYQRYQRNVTELFMPLLKGSKSGFSIYELL